MLNQSRIIACKELKDALRDSRSLVSSLFYLLMGPGIVLLIAAARPGANGVLTAMASIFVMISAFSGGMNVAMDTVAGERERQSLLPLLLNAVSRRDVVIGKWLAVATFSCIGLLVNTAAFSMVLGTWGIFPKLPLLLPLALLAGALEVFISTCCRSVKEAHTYLSFLVFLPMAAGMVAVFAPRALAHWSWLVPILGQQMAFAGKLTIAQSGVLLMTSMLATALALLAAANRMERDDVIYGS